MLLDHPTLGDVQSYEYLRGTMMTINFDLDTCMVEVGGGIVDALIFYH